VLTPAPENDRYRRLRLLGEGGAGRVWLVEDRFRPGVRIALKEPLAGLDADAEALRREFAMLARLRHPGVVEPYELDRAPATGVPRFSLAWVEGSELPTAVAAEGSRLCLEMTAEALRVLAFLHDFGLIHRDLKPANLLVRPHPRLGCRLTLLDLGLAVQSRVGLDASGRGPAGTLPYLAPELFSGAAASPRSDLYALGAVLYEVAHGHPPFDPRGRDLSTFVEAVRTGKRSRPPLREGYPDGFAGWLEELLCPDPSGRPAEAREALARLNTACGTRFPTETAADRAARLASDPPVGREAEFREIWRQLEPVSGPRVIWLQGPAGGGKSRLLRWLQTEAILRGWEVEATSSTVAGGGSGPLTESPDAQLRRLRHLAAERPTLWLFDELEAADGRTLRAIERVAREGKAPPLQVVAAVRPAEVTRPRLRRLLDDTQTVPTLHAIPIGPLGSDAIRAVAERATGSRALSAARVSWLSSVSEGNPLLVEAMLVEGAWETTGRTRPPEVLERSIQARWNLLTPEARDWLEALAVLGRDAPEAAAVALSGLDPGRAADAAEETRLAGLTRVAGDRWSPDSHLVAETIRQRIPAARRHELYGQAACLLSGGEWEGRDPWRLARLWSAAAEPGRALDCAVSAARRSLAEGVPDRAAEQFAFALHHCPRRGPERLRLRIDQATALMSAGLHSAAARAFGAALRLTRDRAERADLLARQADALVHAGRFARGQSVAAEAVALAGADRPLERARALAASGVVLGRLGREPEAERLFEEALGLARQCGDRELEAETLQNLATCKARLQRPEAETDFREAIALFRDLGREGSELRSLVGVATIHLRAGRLQRAEERLEEVRAKAARLGHLDLLETALSKLSSLATERGRLDRALSLGHEALDQARHLGDRNRMIIARCRLAEALIGCGRPAEAVDLLRDALSEPTHEVEPDMLDSARMLMAHALLEVPGADAESVRVPLTACLEGFRRRRKTRSLLMALVIEMERRVDTDAGEPFEPVHREFEALAASSGIEPEPEIRIRAELARAKFLLRRGNASGARDEARSAAAIAARVGLAGYEARALGLVARALEPLGEADEAARAARQAVERLDAAAECIADPEIRRSFLERPAFRSLRSAHPAVEGGSERRLVALYDMIRALNSETDPDGLLETILDMAIRAVPAERGMILLRDDPAAESFTVRVSRQLDPETEEDARNYSSSIVARAGSGQAILALDAGQDERFRDLKSVSLYGIRSLMCVPLRSRGAIVGTVYLDSRHGARLFTPEDLRFLEAFADHAALALHNLRERAALIEENRRLQTAAESRVRFGNIVGRSPGMQRVFELIEKVAGSVLPVLIEGESGTGKELVARAIHAHGPRRRKIFLSENCAAIPETLLESELFGHVRGAFTGADRDRQGLFEQADGGTLFLDEVGDMTAAMQARLLRVVQEGELRRVGGDRPIRVDVRVIAATHRDLQHEVEAGRFREDLLYRLQVLPIRIPALRERPEDVSPLIDFLLERIARERGRPAPAIEPEVRVRLERYAWPGNVRQLENTLQRLALLAGDRPISLAVLCSDDSCRRTVLADQPEEAAQAFSLDDAARDQVRRALQAAGGNRERAARLLGVSRATIYRKIKHLGL